MICPVLLIFVGKMLTAGAKWLHLSSVKQGRSQGDRGKSPAKPKKMLQKNGVISEGSIFRNRFSKKIKNTNKKSNYSIFLQNFHQKISKSSQIFPTICVFHAQKLTDSLLSYLKLFHSRNFLKKTFENFQRFSQKFSANCVFLPKSQKLTHALLNCEKTMLK